MTDLVAVAGNAVAAYQRALGTVSNNISNVATVGYSRQEISLEANPVSKVGNVFLGTGVNVAGVKRQYDAFTEANLRNSNSDLASQGPMVNYANRVIDVMGGATTGLTTALDQFFNSARDLSTNPASTVLRSSFVRDAQGLTSRFGELSSQLDMVQTETDQAIQSNVSNMNTICSALANVNKQLTKVQTEAAQPPDLLDQRDKLLKDLSSYAHVNARFTVNGTVTVSLGSSINQDVVVSGNTSKLLSASSDPQFPGKTNLILDQYGQPSTLSNLTSGSLSGLLSFQEQVLSSTRSALDNLATTLTDAINTVHEQGIDGYGKTGGHFSRSIREAALRAASQVAIVNTMKILFPRRTVKGHSRLAIRARLGAELRYAGASCPRRRPQQFARRFGQQRQPQCGPRHHHRPLPPRHGCGHRTQWHARREHLFRQCASGPAAAGHDARWPPNCRHGHQRHIA